MDGWTGGWMHEFVLQHTYRTNPNFVGSLLVAGTRCICVGLTWPLQDIAIANIVF